MTRTAAALLTIAIAVLSGCTVAVQTPDGHTLLRGRGFVKGTSEASALSILGEPDLIAHRLHVGIISSETVTIYYYLDRKYAVWFAYWGFKGLQDIEDSELPNLERRSRAFKQVRVGTPIDTALAALGTPDLADLSRPGGVALWQEPWAQYQQQRGSVDAPDLHGAVWKNRDLSVEFRNGEVEGAYPDYEAKSSAPVSP